MTPALTPHAAVVVAVALYAVVTLAALAGRWLDGRATRTHTEGVTP